MRLFGNSLGNCLYDKEFISGKKTSAEKDKETPGLLIKKPILSPTWLTQRVSTNMQASPDVRQIKTENPEDVMENDLNSMNSMRKRNLDTVYPNRVSATPDSFTKDLVLWPLHMLNTK